LRYRNTTNCLVHLNYELPKPYNLNSGLSSVSFKILSTYGWFNKTYSSSTALPELSCCRVTKQTGLFPFCGKYDKQFTTLSYSGNRISHGGKYTHAPLQCASSRGKFSTQATLLFTTISYTCKLFIALASDLSL